MPDAVISFENDLHKAIIVDAKFYQTEISSATIRKSLDDMALRDTPYGLLVCSEGAGLAKFKHMAEFS